MYQSEGNPPFLRFRLPFLNKPPVIISNLVLKKNLSKLSILMASATTGLGKAIVASFGDPRNTLAYEGVHMMLPNDVVPMMASMEVCQWKHSGD